MAVTIVHPGNESFPKAATPPSRLASLKGKKIGLLDISKPGGSFFLDRLEEILRTRYGAAAALPPRKPLFSKTAPPKITEQRRAMEGVVEGLAVGGSCTPCSLHDTIVLKNLGVPAVPVATTEFTA